MCCAKAAAATLLLSLSVAACPATGQGVGGAGFSAVQTDRVAQSLSADIALCRTVAAPYGPDCYRQAYSAAARILSNNAAYWEAKVALQRVDRQLSAFLSEATDRSARRLKAGGRRLVAVEPARLTEAAALLAEATARAETLLRSGSPAERTHFAAIADAVSTTGGLASP